MIRQALFFISMFFCVSANAAEIKDIRIGQHPDKIRLVVEMVGAAEFQAKITDAPQRLIVHIPSQIWQGRIDNLSGEPFISFQQTRTSQGHNKLTFGLREPYVIQTAFVLGSGAQNNHRLVIDLVPKPRSEFLKQAGKAHGPLNVVDSNNQQSLDNLIAGISSQDANGIVPKDKPAIPRKPIIVIDAGHGGKDPGAISPRGIQEKKITLSMAKTIARVLNETGRYDARLTRTKDVYIKLYNRVKIAQNANADLFVSVHADSVRNNKTRGASVYTLSDTASDAQTAKLAARENRADLIGGMDLNHEDEDIGAILINLSMRETMNQSKTLANTLVQGFNSGGVNLLKGPHRYAGFAVLKAPDIPSVLIETGFVSNESEARKLLSSEYQTRIARALLKSLDQYYNFN